MENTRFKKTKKPNYKRGFVLLILLIVIIYLWMHVDNIVAFLFRVK